MNDEAQRWQATEAIFHEALQAPEPSRSAILNARCEGDATLLAELRALLAACEAEEIHRLSVSPDSVRAGASVGPYVIEALVGRGGMGAVYRARRSDGQFEQQVAIKIIDMPLASDVFRERFRTERQMLAGLAHPYIARLLDGGVTEDGELYLAMELVDGLCITDFCQKHALTVAARVLLFLKVCEAVQYAHRNLIVHRDLKPENILVTEECSPRLLDFGTAKIIQPLSETATDNFTHPGMQAFTPRYASPEQVLGQPISTASDIYSLGVLLYLLLTGSPPYTLADFSTEEMVRVICHQEPKRPSSMLPVARNETAGLDADLDAIVLMALRKEPGDRYSTVEQFAADLQAWLDHRPVSARRGNLRYLAGKFLLRNKLAVSASAIILLLSVGGVAAIVRQSRLVEGERQRAEARSADLRELSNSLLSELSDALKEIPGTTGVQQLVVTRVLQHLDRMAADSDGDRQTEIDLINAYTRLGNVQGNIYYQNLADTKGAVSSFDKALALARALAAAYPQDREVLRVLAATLEAKGEVLSDTDSAEQSTANLKDAVAVYDRVVALPGVTPSLIFEAAIAYETLGNELGEDSGMADLPAATAAYRRALDMDMHALKLDPGYMAVRRGVPLMHLHLGALVLDSDPAHALEEFTLAQRLAEELPEDQRKKLSQVRVHTLFLRKQGQANAELGRYAAARALFAQTTEVSYKLVAADVKNVGALRDLQRSQDNWAQCEEYASDEVSTEPATEVRKALQSARQHLQEEVSTIQRVISQSPTSDQNDLQLQSVQIRLSAILARLNPASQNPSDPTLSSALAALAAAADKTQVTAGDLESAASAFLQVGPQQLRRPDLALGWARRADALTHHRSPAFLLLLSVAYQANHQPQEAATTAREGLAQLPQPGQHQPETHLIRMLRSLAGKTSTSAER